MKVLELKTKRIVDVDDSYGERLIQHGMAVLPPEMPRKEQPTPKKAQKEPPSRKGDA